MRRHGAITLLQWDPTLASVPRIAAGGYDRYLRSFADSVRAFGGPVVIGFGHEMNAYWYSWGYQHTPAATFVAAWRHIVTLFRARGAGNVTWLWTLQADEPGTGPVAAWWPGARYVTWVGIDGYYYRPGESFSSIFGPTIAQVRMLTGQPVLLSETAVGPQAGQAAKIPGLFAGMREYGALGLVWFEHRPARRDLPSGLARRGRPRRRDGVPPRRRRADSSPPLTGYRTSGAGSAR